MINTIEKNLYIKESHLYDLDNRELVKIDIPFYIEFAKKIKGPILELACGTGRVTIPLAEAKHEIWGLELSETMRQVIINKMKKIPTEIAKRIHIIEGDMSNFCLDKKFPLIIIPYRSFQILCDEQLETNCLKSVYHNLSDDGFFIITLGNYAKVKDSEWNSGEEIIDWENTDPETGYKVRRTHMKKGIDTKNQVVHIQKNYYIIKDNGTVEKIVKRISAKYFSEAQIENLLLSNGFKIVKKMGYYDGRPLGRGNELIFICTKL